MDRGRVGSAVILDRERFEVLYLAYNRREYLHPDPLAVVCDYGCKADREIAGLIASSLAYGRVVQILTSLEKVFGVMGGSPNKYLLSRGVEQIETDFAEFRHRWTSGRDLSGLLIGVRQVLIEFGSLEAFFLDGMDDNDPDVVAALGAFVEGLKRRSGAVGNKLLADPEKGSACKRLNLFLRWMVRQDDVDPGGWTGVDPSRLVIPLDTHMHRICRSLGLTERRQADLKCAVEITRAFRTISPSDPVKYDFSLTRFGIRGDLSVEELLERVGE